MARPGITYQDVASAVHQLIAAEKQPTIENIRIMLGTGSHSTIASHLRSWKANQESNYALAAKENLPEELVALLKGLWQRIMDDAGDKIQLIQEEAAQLTSELRADNQRVQKENTYWQEQYQQIKTLKEVLETERAVQTQAISHLETEKISLLVTQDHLNQQLIDKQTRIDELYHAQQQAQANLEHYRDATREQRMLDLQRYDQAHLHHEQIAHDLRKQLANSLEEKNTLQVNLTQIATANEQTQQQNQQLSELAEKTKQQADQYQQALFALTHVKEHLEKSYHDCQVLANESQTMLMAIQTQQAIKEQQLADLTLQFKALKDENALLQREQWQLTNEKDRLVKKLNTLKNEK